MTTVKPGAVVDIATAALPPEVPTTRITAMLAALDGIVRGSFADDSEVARLYRHYKLLLVALMRGEVLDDRTLQLGLYLEEIARAIAKTAAAPATARPEDAARTTELAQRLAAMQEALADMARERDAALVRATTHRDDLVRTTAERDAARADAARADAAVREATDHAARADAALQTATARVAQLDRELAAAKAGVADAERVQLDAFRRAVDALRAEGTAAAQAVAELAALAGQLRATHGEVTSAVETLYGAAHGAATMTAVAERLAVEAAITAREAWLQNALAHGTAVDEELDEISVEDPVLAARVRTKTATRDEHRRVAAIAARRTQLDSHLTAVRLLQSVVEDDLRKLRARLDAIAQLAEPFAPPHALPALPAYPEEPVEDAVPAPAEPETKPDGATNAGDDTAPDDTPPPDPQAIAAAVAIFVACYELIARHEDATGSRRMNRTIGKVSRIAFRTVRAIQEHGWNVLDFLKLTTRREAAELRDRYLRYRGQMGGFLGITYNRTEEPIPDAWITGIPDAERDAFVREYFAPSPAAPASNE